MNGEEILNKARAENLLDALADQLQKDFTRAGVPVPSFKPEAPDASWVQELRESLYRLLMERTDDYLNLMYAADVDPLNRKMLQAEFRRIPLTDMVDIAAASTDLLLQREWQKVCWRSGREDR